jgi:hypothetical protein|tara:strand:- start:486 stop:746 length:261 start_codon:yes stop_codon:yes gene_type:complete
MKVLAFLFWFFFILYILKFLFRIFVPILMSRFIKKTSQRFEHQFNQNSNTRKDEEGKVSIDKNTSTDSNKKSDNIGDYVDFEEVDD